jgi:hypothetical protein
MKLLAPPSGPLPTGRQAVPTEGGGGRPGRGSGKEIGMPFAYSV